MDNIIFNDIPMKNLSTGIVFCQPIKLTINDLFLLSKEEIDLLYGQFNGILEVSKKEETTRLNKVILFPSKYISEKDNE